MRLLVLAVCLAGCQRAHDVSIQIGPDDETLTIGFQCKQDDGTLLAERAHVGGMYRFSVVVDVIDLGGRLAGCRGEELVKTCAVPGTCTVVPRDDGTRYCVDVVLPETIVHAGGQKDLIDLLRPQLEAQVVTTDAPDRPVMLRAVATTEPCDTFRSSLAPFDQARVTGCAYSCPVQLDAVAGPVALSLDSLNDRCASQVGVCAAFPR